jgi:integrase/recombinase XerD
MGNTLLPSQIDEFLLVKDSEGISEATHTKYEKGLKTFKTFLGNEDVTRLKFIEFFAYMHKKNYSDWYQKTLAQVLKTCFKYLISAGYDFPNPDYRMPKIHRKKLTYLTQDQIKKLLKSDLNSQELIIIRLFISTGLRMNELLMLNWKDVNFKSGAIAVNYGKGDKYRTVVTDKPTLVLLLRLKNKNEIEDIDSPLIWHGDYERYTTMGMRSLINRIRQKTDIFFTAHALRRTFARQAVINGMGLEFVQQLMGHESVEMTRHYVGMLDVNDLVRTYNKHKVI